MTVDLLAPDARSGTPVADPRCTPGAAERAAPAPAGSRRAAVSVPLLLLVGLLAACAGGTDLVPQDDAGSNPPAPVPVERTPAPAPAPAPLPLNPTGGPPALDGATVWKLLTANTDLEFDAMPQALGAASDVARADGVWREPLLYQIQGYTGESYSLGSGVLRAGSAPTRTQPPIQLRLRAAAAAQGAGGTLGEQMTVVVDGTSRTWRADGPLVLGGPLASPSGTVQQRWVDPNDALQTAALVVTGTIDQVRVCWQVRYSPLVRECCFDWGRGAGAGLVGRRVHDERTVRPDGSLQQASADPLDFTALPLWLPAPDSFSNSD